MAGVGIDVGYGYTKGHSRTLESEFPSLAGPAQKLQDMGINFQNVGYHMQTPLNMFVGDLAVQQRVGTVNFDANWFVSDEYRALLLTAIATVTNSFYASYVLVTGLPIAHMHLASQLEARLKGEHKVQLNSGSQQKTIVIERVKVVAQGIGIHLSELINDDGRAVASVQDLKYARVGILDPGSRTTNYVGTEGIAHIAGETGTIQNTGTWTVENMVRKWLDAHYPGRGDTMTSFSLMQAILSRRMWDAGREVDLTEPVETAIDQVSNDILNTVGRHWGNGRDFRQIRVGGGGGELFFPKIKEHYPHAVLIDTPRQGNVLGFFRLAQFLATH